MAGRLESGNCNYGIVGVVSIEELSHLSRAASLFDEVVSLNGVDAVDLEYSPPLPGNDHPCVFVWPINDTLDGYSLKEGDGEGARVISKSTMVAHSAGFAIEKGSDRVFYRLFLHPDGSRHG